MNPFTPPPSPPRTPPPAQQQLQQSSLSPQTPPEVNKVGTSFLLWIIDRNPSWLASQHPRRHHTHKKTGGNTLHRLRRWCWREANTAAVLLSGANARRHHLPLRGRLFVASVGWSRWWRPAATAAAAGAREEKHARGESERVEDDVRFCVCVGVLCGMCWRVNIGRPVFIYTRPTHTHIHPPHTHTYIQPLVLPPALFLRTLPHQHRPRLPPAHQGPLVPPPPTTALPIAPQNRRCDCGCGWGWEWERAPICAPKGGGA